MTRFFRKVAWHQPLLMLLACLSAVLPTLAQANTGEQKQVIGKYEVHYIGLSTSFLPEKAAAAYNIPRSGSLGYMSISILNTEIGDLPTPVTAVVTGEVANLIGQTREISFREIIEQNAVYYITTLRFDDQDTYRVKLSVTPEGESQPITVKFNQKFYEEDE